MRVPARIYVDSEMLAGIFGDRSLEQLVNLTTLPGVEKYSLAMPDIHEGYGSPIGGVFAVSAETGVISPGAVGYDINCGVRLLLSPLSFSEATGNLEKLAAAIQSKVPSGLGRGHRQKLKTAELDKILARGAEELVSQGYGRDEDIENCEARGFLKEADPAAVSSVAKSRGGDQLGTLGSGNHFLEIQRVEEIFDEKAARVFGLFKNQLTVMIHTGSRGLGHQIATDYIRLMARVMPRYGISLPDQELASAPIKSEEGRAYFRAMACGANFAWANRQMITYLVREAWREIFNEEDPRVLYDVAHNIAKFEDGLLVHRKGATRAFPAGHPEIPEKYREFGQPVLIPGSMGTASYVLRGVKEAEAAFYSTCHGAGRRMSRHQAIKSLSGRDIVKDLEQKGIMVKCYSSRGIAEEAPQAYKDIDQVVEVVHQAGLSKKVARLLPLAVIKGE
jgi:tRNA-splicing ligase RtcB